jgi:hypothetical protein
VSPAAGPREVSTYESMAVYWRWGRWAHARGGRGDGAPVGGAPERSLQRERVCGSGGSSLRGANDQLRFTGSLVGPISLICQRPRASDRLSAKLLCGRVRGRQAAHRRVIDAPSSSSDQQGVKLVERSHRRQTKRRGADGTRGGRGGSRRGAATRAQAEQTFVRAAHPSCV